MTIPQTANTQPSHRRWLKWGLIVGLWILVALMFSAQFYFAMQAEAPEEEQVAWINVFFFQLILWGEWIVFTPVVLWLAQRVTS